MLSFIVVENSVIEQRKTRGAIAGGRGRTDRRMASSTCFAGPAKRVSGGRRIRSMTAEALACVEEIAGARGLRPIRFLIIGKNKFGRLSDTPQTTGQMRIVNFSDSQKK
jgi:hypothetical protein